jgi:glycosyltransferase involved in cell wall biosynthesis
MKLPKIAYISFDIVPAPKGAATHITAFAKALGTVFGKIDLFTVSPNTESNYLELYPNVMQTTLPAIGYNFINRVLYFQAMLSNYLLNNYYDVIHFRSIFEGYPIAINKHKFCKQIIFEVNGLPSIELKYRYPAVVEDRELLYKLREQEKICLDKADLIITPSQVTSHYLQKLGVFSGKIVAIPNGVDLNIFTFSGDRNLSISPFKLLYFGTLSAWQGVNLAIEAMALANRDFATELTVIALGKQEQFTRAIALARKLQVEDKLIILEAISQPELVKHIHQSNAIIVSLTPSDRNLLQGCCPLKILEGMATGTPVIASDLPVVRELGESEKHFLLVKPASAKAIKDAVLQLKNEPQLSRNLAINARQQIETYYTWERAGKILIENYQKLL